MKIGVYISGLGQSFVNETVEKYAIRLMNEMKFHTNGIAYDCKTERIEYTPGQESTVVSIYEQGDPDKVVYKLYDFAYHDILTEAFNDYSLLRKNLRLLSLVVKKLPLIVKMLFFRNRYNHPFQALYIFGIFMLIATAVLLMLPAALSVIVQFFDNEKVMTFVNDIKGLAGVDDIPFISQAIFNDSSKILVSFTSILILFMPNANVLITKLATEFVCANDYLEHGAQRQAMQGNLDLLVDYISENETDCKIHFHTYSFGSIVAIDYVYPFGNKASRNAEMFCEAMVTIGTPFEFIDTYYPQFYQARRKQVGDQLHWLNVYSIADPLATNFRQDAQCGTAEFGVKMADNKPFNINYEVVSMGKTNFISYFMLHNLKMHGMYWDKKTEGQSCLRLVYEEMKERKLL